MFVFRTGSIYLYSRKITLLKILAPLWDELEERQRRKFLKDIREKGDSFTEKRREGQIQRGRTSKDAGRGGESHRKTKTPEARLRRWRRSW